jgi:hypothetical protein
MSTRTLTLTRTNPYPHPWVRIPVLLARVCTRVYGYGYRAISLLIKFIGIGTYKTFYTTSIIPTVPQGESEGSKAAVAVVVRATWAEVELHSCCGGCVVVLVLAGPILFPVRSWFSCSVRVVLVDEILCSGCAGP